MGTHDLSISCLDPRVYQIELFERAKTRNIIAVLDTGMSFASQRFYTNLLTGLIGSGKTLIAVLLLKYILQQELVDRAVGKPPRIAFFLVTEASSQG